MYHDRALTEQVTADFDNEQCVTDLGDDPHCRGPCHWPLCSPQGGKGAHHRAPDL